MGELGDPKTATIRVEIPGDVLPEDDGALSDEGLKELTLKLNALGGAVSFARETWYNDGAEGETVHLLAWFAERLPTLLKRLLNAEERLDIAPIIGVQGMEDWDEVCERCNTGTDEPHDRADCMQQELSTSDYVTWSLACMLDAAHIRDDLVRKKIDDLRVFKLAGFVREPKKIYDPQSKVGQRADHILEAGSILRNDADSARIAEWLRKDKELSDDSDS